MTYLPDTHEDVQIVVTDFLSISRSMDVFGSIDDYENFTLEVYDFIAKTFSDAYIAKGELYPESIGCEIQYLVGNSEELYEICQAICKEFGIHDLTIESDLFQSHRDEILEEVGEKSFDWIYDRGTHFVHVRQVIQGIEFTPEMSLGEFAMKTDTMASTIIQSGIESKEDCTLRWVPEFLYSEYRTNHIEE